MKRKSSKTAKRVAAGAAGAVAAAGLLLHTAVADPESLLKPNAQTATDPSHVCVVDGTEQRSYILEADEDEPLTLRECICVPFMAASLVLLMTKVKETKDVDLDNITADTYR